jgi:hypothetical protein
MSTMCTSLLLYLAIASSLCDLWMREEDFTFAWACKKDLMKDT